MSREAHTTALSIVDWSKVVNFEPELFYKPDTKQALIDFLKNNRHLLETRSIRIIGSLHSCSHINKTDCVIEIGNLPKEISFSEDNTRVSVSANWTLSDFLNEVAKNKKSLPATGGTNTQTLAGVISTNTAPASKWVSIYQGLTSLTYITLEGDEVVEKTVTRDSDPQFLGAICSLGAIGVIVNVEFELVEQPYYETIQKIVPLKDVLDDLDETSKEYPFWRINWLPKSDKGLFWGAKAIPYSPEIAEGDYSPEFTTILDTAFKAFNLVRKIAGLSPIGPTMTPEIQIVYEIFTQYFTEQKAAGPLRNMLPVDRRVDMRVSMAEWSFAPGSLRRVLDVYRDYFEREGWPTIPTEIELTQTDAYHMSPWNWDGEDYVVKINVMYLSEVLDTVDKLTRMYGHIEGLWRALQRAGIPFKAHWGKIHFMDHEFVKRNFKLDDFLPLTKSIFMNEYLSRKLHGNPAGDLSSAAAAQGDPFLREEFSPESLSRASHHIRMAPNSFSKANEPDN